jgi:hypothetical protein
MSPSQGRYLHTEQHKETKRKHIISTPQVGFEPMIPVFEWAKIVYALDPAATVTGITEYSLFKSVQISYTI